MTIPIKPGPFSFLAELGRAGGAAVSEAEKAREKRLKEDRERINMMVLLRQQGLITPESFGSPEAMALYQRTGITPISTERTSGEEVESVRRGYFRDTAGSTPTGAAPSAQSGLGPNPLQGMHPGGFGLPMEQMITGGQQPAPQAVAPVPPPAPDARTVGRQLAAGLPNPLDVGRAVQAPGTLRAEAATAATTAATQEAALPGAGSTAVAQQQTQQDLQYDDIADRVVWDEYVKRGNKFPTSAEAYRIGLGDPRNKFRDQISEPYYGAAIQRLQNLLEAQKTARIGASARYAASDQFDNVARIYQRQAEILTTQLNDLPKTMGLQKGDPAMASIAAKAIAQGRTDKLSPVIVDAHRRYTAYEAKATELRNQISEYQRRLNPALAGRLDVTQQPAAGLPGQEGVGLDDDQINNAVKRGIQSKMTVGAFNAQVDQDVANGLISGAAGTALKNAFRTAKVH